jgi:hypothetical protein
MLLPKKNILTANKLILLPENYPLKNVLIRTNGLAKQLHTNKTGNVIYEKELRTIGGHASVEFTFYPNGALNKASWSSAPDAGIQWYNSTDIFSEDGKLVSHTEKQLR